MLCVDVAGVAIHVLLPLSYRRGRVFHGKSRPRSRQARRYKLRRSDEQVNSAKCNSRGNGYAEVKARSFSHGAFHPEASAMCFHDMTGDREAQAGATGLAGTRGIYPVEAFKDPFLLRLWDSDAGIGNGDHNTAIGARGGNVDFSTGGR